MLKRWTTCILALLLVAALVPMAGAQSELSAYLQALNDEAKAEMAEYEALPPNVRYFQMKWPMHVGGLEPLPDGGVVLSGWLTYPGTERDLDSIGYENPVDAQDYDGFAVRLDGGRETWSLRLGDPQAINSMICRGLLPDGRLLMTLYGNDQETFGTQHYIVGQDGIVEEMLPAKKLAAYLPPKGIELTRSGYLGGGALGIPVDNIFGENYPQDLVMLDFDLTERWRVEDIGTMMGILYTAEAEDGSVFIARSDEHNTAAAPGQYGFAFTLTKLSADGKTLWTYEDSKADGPFLYGSEMLPTRDGGVLMLGTYVAEGEANVLPDRGAAPTLTAFDKDGKPQWTKDYGDVLSYVGSAIPFGEGLLISGATSIYHMAQQHALLYVSAEDGELLAPPMPVHGGLSREPDGGEHGLAEWAMETVPGLAPTEDGGAYVYGMMNDPMDWENRTDGAPRMFFYAKVDAAHFEK